MPDVEKVVNALEWLLENMVDPFNDFMLFDYDGPIVLANKPIIEDALALLKAQEPRLLTWDELVATDHVYIETNKDGQKYIVPGIVTIVRDTAVIASVRIGTRLIDGTIDKDVYGIECRCWTSRPTDEQREAVKWE